MFFGCFCVWKGKNHVEKLGREQNWAKNGLKGAGAFYSPGTNFEAEGFKLPLIGLILIPLERSWLPISKKVWILKIQRLDQKLWLSKVNGASIYVLSQFSWYLSHPNSNFDPWIIVGMRIWLSSQWHWFKSILMAWSKLGFLGPLGLTPGQTWSNQEKISEKLGFDVKLWKILFCEGFDLVWPSVKPRVN